MIVWQVFGLVAHPNTVENVKCKYNLISLRERNYNVSLHIFEH